MRRSINSEHKAEMRMTTTEILPTRGWQAIRFGELWEFRGLFYFLIWRDVKVRYRQTVLGAAWAVLQPAMMMLVFTVFLGVMAKIPAANDPVFVYAGMLPWTFFTTAMAGAGLSLVSNERLITKIYFPRLTIPWSAVGAAIVDFLIALILLLAMMIWRGIPPGAGLLLAPVTFGLIALAAAGIGTILAALTVEYRDFKYLIPFMVQLWLFATPSVYSRTPLDASPWLQVLLLLNPMNGLIASFRAAMFNEPIPWNMLFAAAVPVVLVFIVGCLYFRRVEDSFADVV
jgi:lipopolysaccharide transport system permease protein